MQYTKNKPRLSNTIKTVSSEVPADRGWLSVAVRWGRQPAEPQMPSRGRGQVRSGHVGSFAPPRPAELHAVAGALAGSVASRGGAAARSRGGRAGDLRQVSSVLAAGLGGRAPGGAHEARCFRPDSGPGLGLPAAVASWSRRGRVLCGSCSRPF